MSLSLCARWRNKIYLFIYLFIMGIVSRYRRMPTYFRTVSASSWGARPQVVLVVYWGVVLLELCLGSSIMKNRISENCRKGVLRLSIVLSPILSLFLSFVEVVRSGVGCYKTSQIKEFCSQEVWAIFIII